MPPQLHDRFRHYHKAGAAQLSMAGGGSRSFKWGIPKIIKIMILIGMCGRKVSPRKYGRMVIVNLQTIFELFDQATSVRVFNSADSAGQAGYFNDSFKETACPADTSTKLSSKRSSIACGRSSLS